VTRLSVILLNLQNILHLSLSLSFLCEAAKTATKYMNETSAGRVGSRTLIEKEALMEQTKTLFKNRHLMFRYEIVVIHCGDMLPLYCVSYMRAIYRNFSTTKQT